MRPKKEEQLCRVAKEAEACMKDGHTRWDSIRNLLCVHTGRRLNRPSAVLKEGGTRTQSPSEVLEMATTLLIY